MRAGGSGGSVPLGAAQQLVARCWWPPAAVGDGEQSTYWPCNHGTANHRQASRLRAARDGKTTPAVCLLQQPSPGHPLGTACRAAQARPPQEARPSPGVAGSGWGVCTQPLPGDAAWAVLLHGTGGEPPVPVGCRGHGTCRAPSWHGCRGTARHGPPTRSPQRKPSAAAPSRSLPQEGGCSPCVHPAGSRWCQQG